LAASLSGSNSNRTHTMCALWHPSSRPSGDNTAAVRTASTSTITAIPEPSTYVAAIGLLALMLWPLRRRLRGKVS